MEDCFSVVLGMGVLACFALALRLRQRVRALEESSEGFEARSKALTDRLRRLEAEMRAFRGGTGAVAPASDAEALGVSGEVSDEGAQGTARPSVPLARPQAPSFRAPAMPAAIPPPMPSSAEPVLPVPGTPAPRPPGVPSIHAPATLAASVAPAVPSTSVAPDAGSPADGSERAPRPAALPPPLPPPRPPAPPKAPPPPAKPFDWEQLVGVRLFSWIAGIALVLAAIFFLRYSVERGWLSPPVRLAIGLLTGTALLVVCELKAARRYRTTANALDAAGIAILFASLFAAHALWHLITAPVVFGLMALVTAVAVLLSLRRDSVFIALLGLVGGFATPALLSTGEDHAIGLFGYLLLLNAGLAWVAYRKRWSALTLLSLVFTTIYQWGWVAKFLAPEKFGLAVGIFLVFPVFAFIALVLGERRSAGANRGASSAAPAELSVFHQAVAFGAVLPLLFALFAVSVPAYGAQAGLLFGYLGCVVVGLFVIALMRGPQELFLGGGIASVLALAVWLRRSYQPSDWPRALFFAAAFILFHLAAPFIARRLKRPLDSPAVHGVLAAPLLLLVFPVLAAIEPATAAPGLLFGMLLVLLAAIGFTAVRLGYGPLYLIGAFFGVATEAVWSANRLTPERQLAALGIYAGFAAFFLGVPMLARRAQRALQPAGGGAILLFASLGLLFFLTHGAVAEGSLWGLSLLLILLNLGLFFEGGAGRLPLLAAAGSLLSWVLLGVWWSAVGIASHLVPAISVVGGFGIVVLAGNLWAWHRRSATQAAESSGLPPGAIWIGLVGHAFLLFVATQPALALPPWPLLAVLLVLDLAVAVASLWTRNGFLLLAALGASDVVLAAWEATAKVSPWPTAAVVVAAIVAALGLGAAALAPRLHMDEDERRGFGVGTLVALFLAEGVVILATALAGMPDFWFLVGAHVVFLSVLLAIAARAGQNVLAVVAVAPAVLGVAIWRFAATADPSWNEQLLFCGVLWALFLLYPLLLGHRARTSRTPFLAPVLAGGAFFVLGRDAFLRGGLGWMIGALPLIQAAAFTPLLLRLLRLQPAGQRDRGRLALIAGAMLAFVTVAIPLQLEKQWITIGWALLAAALAWLYRRVPHGGLLLWAGGLAAAVFARLALNPAVLSYHARQGAAVLNWYLYSYLVCAAALLLAARLLRNEAPARRPVPLPGLLSAAATVLLFLLLNIEIADFFSTGETLTFGFLGGSAGLPEDLAYTIGWGVFAIGMLAAGIALRSRVTRICAIVLLVATVVKAFLHDTWKLGGLYRVGSFVGLAICLALVAIVLQRFVLTPSNEETGTPEDATPPAGPEQSAADPGTETNPSPEEPAP